MENYLSLLSVYSKFEDGDGDIDDDDPFLYMYIVINHDNQQCGI